MKEEISAYLISIKVELIAFAFVGLSLVTATHLMQLATAIVAFISVVRTYIKKNKK